MKRYMLMIFSAMFCVVCFSLYLMLESTNMANARTSEIGENDLNSIEAKIKQIEVDLNHNSKIINMIKDAVRDIANGDNDSLKRLQAALDLTSQMKQKPPGLPEHPADHQVSFNLNSSMLTKSLVALPPKVCSLASQPPAKVDIQMLDVFNQLSFDDPDGGVWKQGFPISYNTQQWDELPLNVFVIPHSHCDPGWLKTFERYYQEQAKHILDNMLEKLEAYPEMRFIYAEMSFFYMWWNELSAPKQERCKKLIEKGQFEIVTGGWVMNDEANTHYFAMIDQMIEGNQWLLNHLGVKPVSGWAIDPFGHSSTMPYLLKRMGFENMLIQRTHYTVKKHLSKSKNLEYAWRQNWDTDGSTDMFCHMMPFYSYDVPHTCGPDPKICCQFDFRRLPGSRVTCPWKVPPQAITENNIQERAETLLDQYRKKSQLYRNSIVLVPLGDDFRYDKAIEWDQQFTNYKKLMDYMNARTDWKVKIQFGTLTDYFNALHKRAGTKQGAMPPGYPVLAGDFFSYADREDHYWSGYYTSRPFYKRLDRVLEDHIRGGEILFSIATSKARKLKLTSFHEIPLMRELVMARRSLGLFQHHDGITGTAKDFVVVDYGQKLLEGIKGLKKVIRDCAHFLLTRDKDKYQHVENAPYFDLDEVRDSHDALPKRTIVKVSQNSRPVVLYNSLAQTRTSVVRLYVNNPHIEVQDPLGNVIPTQVDPFWSSYEGIDKDVFKVNFIATVPAIGLAKYTIRQVSAGANSHNSMTAVSFYNVSPLGAETSGVFEVQRKAIEDFSIDNSEMRADFDAYTGMLKNMYMKASQQKVGTAIEFLTYGTRHSKDRSGAYLFLPDGEAKPVTYQSPVIRVLKGPIVSEVHVFIPFVEHVVRLVNSPGVDGLGLEIYNLVDVRSENNKELVMRIKTDVQNPEQTFYTDLNGFQMQKRKTMSKLPTQANFYPMPSMAYLQDAKWRVSIMSAQALGMASLKQGWLEVIQDRRLNQDDNRGVGQGVLDNKRTPNKFKIMVEKRVDSTQPAAENPAGFPSLTAKAASLQLDHPVFVIPPKEYSSNPDEPGSHLLNSVTPLIAELPCDVHLLNLRTLQNAETNDHRYTAQDKHALLLHRLGFDCSWPARGMTCQVGDGKITLGEMFKDPALQAAQESSLTLIHEGDTLQPQDVISIPQMEIKAFKVSLG